MGHLYLLVPGDFSGGAVKVGRTSSLRRRIGEYPPGSRYLEASAPVADCGGAERALLRVFRASFPRLDVIGREYFAASPTEALRAFRGFCAERFRSASDPMEQDCPAM